jgi:hypothetical protein
LAVIDRDPVAWKENSKVIYADIVHLVDASELPIRRIAENIKN